MRNFIAIMLVLGLASFAIAQDLDGPTMGTPAEQAQEDAQSVTSAVFDALIARVQAAAAWERGDVSRANWEFKTMSWLNTLTGNGRFGQGEIDALRNYEDRDGYEFIGDYDSMSGAEQASFGEVMNDAWESINAAALN